MRKEYVPVLTDGPDKSLILCHGDMDGINGLQVCYKWIEENIGSDHDIEWTNCNYENVNPRCEFYWEHSKDYRYIMLVDICCNEERAKSAPDNVFIFDHHDTSSFIKGMNDRFFWRTDYCGAMVAWKYLFNKNPDPKFKKLLKICNDYDMWQGPDGRPPQISHDLNCLVKYYGFSDFFTRFYDGFDGFNKEEQKYIDEYWASQKRIWNKETTKEKIGDNVVFILIENDGLDANYWCDKLLRDKGYDVVFVSRAHRDRMSVRASDRAAEWWHAGEWLRDNVFNANNSKGGHSKAAGCSTEGMSEEAILEMAIGVQELFDERKDLASA